MRNRLFLYVTSVALIIVATPALARPGGWERPGWGSPGWDRGSGPVRARADSPDRSRDGRIDVDRFVGEDDAAAALGHGPIAVAAQSGEQDWLDAGRRAVFEAAVIDRLVHAGYDTAGTEKGQVAELRIVRTQLDAGGAPRRPVTGEAAMEVGNRGTAYGLAINVDLTKPLPPLVATRLEARIIDSATGKVLWEGRASVSAREGDARWSDQTIAGRLAEALFDGFPRRGDAAASPG